jgi:hypothetical protein
MIETENQPRPTLRLSALVLVKTVVSQPAVEWDA